MDELDDDAEDYWLEGGVDVLTSGAENGFLQEVDRVIDLLGTDESWLAWWRGASRTPTLEIWLVVAKAESEGVDEERVVRGRKRHLVEMRVDFEKLEPFERDERRLLALPAILEGISRACSALKLPGEPPAIPDAAHPAPLTPGVLRRRRLRELRGEPNTPLPDGGLFPAAHPPTTTLTVRSVQPPDTQRLAPVAAVPDHAPADGELIVEIHVPLTETGNVLPGGHGYAHGWIDDIEEFLEDESSDGSFEIYDGAEELDGAYIFFIAGAPAEDLLRVAANVAALPAVPPGAFAVITNDQSEEMGTGHHVALG
ncbi:hypothetical protein [Kribbella sp. CA-294648]|uniref:hypothetical protein n=1 Tax=Kribbella sp. CA-294648 TaxID=3239948 RepID=UPI003D8D7E47